MFYKLNNQIQELPDTEAFKKITVTKIGEVEEILPDGTKYITQGVVKNEVEYIKTITDVYTTQAKPTITVKEKLDLVKKSNNSNGDIKNNSEWIKTPLTEEEITLAINSEYDVVDRETEQNILAGFTYDGKVFSMSPSAQSNWLFLLNELDMGRFPDKWEIAVKDDTDYELTKAKAPAFFKACAIHKETTLKKGRVKKQAVRAKYGR